MLARHLFTLLIGCQPTAVAGQTTRPPWQTASVVCHAPDHTLLALLLAPQAAHPEMDFSNAKIQM